jgi:hypothetical protein
MVAKPKAKPKAKPEAKEKPEPKAPAAPASKVGPKYECRSCGLVSAKGQLDKERPWDCKECRQAFVEVQPEE